MDSRRKEGQVLEMPKEVQVNTSPVTRELDRMMMQLRLNIAMLQLKQTEHERKRLLAIVGSTADELSQFIQYQLKFGDWK